MAEIEIAGEIFNIVVEGHSDAPPLIISNSLGTNLHMWDAQIPALTKHFRVIRYDSRGHGKSVANPGPYSIAQLAQDALNILDHFGVQKAHWLGLSKGGMIGQYLLTHFPERIERAILANTGSAMPPADNWNARIKLVNAQGMGPITPAVIQRWFTPDFIKNSGPAVERIVDMLNTTPPQGYAGCCSAIRDMDQRESIRSIKGKEVLVIVGKHDPATPPEMGAQIAKSIQGAKLVALNAAHLSNIEDEAAFTKAIVGFLTAPAKKAATKKAAPKKATAKKTTAKKAVKPAAVKKAAPKKVAAKKATAKTTTAKKAVVKKATKPVAAKKTTPKKPVAKKAAVKKAPVKKPAAKVTAKKTATKKTAPKKTAVKKTAAKKATPKKITVKKITVKKAAPKKVATKKAVTKKATPKKAVNKTTAKKSKKK